MHDYNNEPDSHKNLLILEINSYQVKAMLEKDLLVSKYGASIEVLKIVISKEIIFILRKIDPEYGVVQIKLATLINGIWNIQFLNYDFDTAVILFMDDKSKNIERLCIIQLDGKCT